MIDLANVNKYRENNRIEAKRALGGLPHSIWETYSAFANTVGGIILLGVEENLKDKSLHTVNLPDPERLVREFWTLINDPRKASVNILTEQDVTVEVVNGDSIVAIRVPRAGRCDKPVYIDGNPMSGSYRRNGEGDYRCTREEIEAMLRDAALKTQDLRVLDAMGAEDLNVESICRYRASMAASRAGHMWETSDRETFLSEIGALGLGEDGELHPTAAGLLMFGQPSQITREYPHYHLEYREETAERQCVKWLDSASDCCCGNLIDFYLNVAQRLAQDIKQRACVADGEGLRDTSVQHVLCEALANCLIHADYEGQEGIVIVKRPDSITFSNPGGFRIDVETAKSGGVSDPRNDALIRMFHLIDVGKRTGSGIPGMFRVWRERGWAAPTITEQFEPERITLRLTFSSCGTPTSAAMTAAHKQAIIEYLTAHIEARREELEALVGLESIAVSELLEELIEAGLITAAGENGDLTYRLHA